MALSDWLLPQPQLVGGPVLTPAHPPSGTNQPGRPAVPPPQMTWGDILNSLSNAQNVAGENKLREMQAQLYGLQGQQAQMGLDLFKNPDKLKQLLGLASPQAGQPAAEPSPFGSLAPPSPNSGASAISDPRGVAPLIVQTAAKYGIDPSVALKVAQSEGAGSFYGDGGTSGGAFQLHVTPGGKGNAVGDQFKRDTGLDPLDPKNEAASIDYALQYAAQNGWGAWNGAKRIGLKPFEGIGTTSGAPDTVNATSSPYPGYSAAEYAALKARGYVDPTTGRPSLPPGSFKLNSRSEPYTPTLGNSTAVPLAAGPSPAPTPPAPNPANIAPTFGSLAPGGPINPGIAGLERFDPVQAALGGSMLEALHMPNIAKPLTDLYVNSPGFAAAKAGAEKWAGVAPELYTKWRSPMPARPGGGIIDPSTGGIVGAMPTIQKIVDPATGQESFVYMTPNGGPGGAPNITPTSGVAGLGPAQRAELEKRGRESVPTAPPGSYVPPGSNAVQVAPGAPEAQRTMGVAGTPPTLRDITSPITGAPEPHWTLPPLGMASPPAGPAQGAAQSPSSGTATPTSVPPPSAPQGAATDMGSGTALRGMSPLYSTGVEGMIKTDQERIEKTLQPQADKANDNIARGQLIQDLLPRIATGQWAEAKQDLSRLLIGLGVSSDVVKHNITDVSAGDVIQKNFLSQSAEAVRQMGAREPGSVISLFNKAYPRVETQENAIKLMQNVFLMQGMRQQDEFNLAQAQHAQAVAALAKEQSYEPLTKFTANFNAGPHSSLNYLRAAQAMSDDGVAWKDAKGPDFENIVALIPKGHHFLGPDGKPYVKN